MLNINQVPTEEKALLIPKEKKQETIINLLTPFQAIKDVISFSTPFTLSRIGFAGIGFVDAIILARLGHTEAAAGPLITSTFNATIATMRTMMLATGILVGKLEGAGNYAEIGDMVRRTWIISAILTIPTCGLLISVAPVLRIIGIAEPIAAIVEDYLWSSMPGTLPLYLLTCDRQFALGIKRKNIPFVINTFYIGLSMLLGYPFALGIWNLPKLGVKGLGYGSSAAAWISLIALRLYYCRAEFKKYRLFTRFNSPVFADFGRILKLCVSKGIQNLTEWGNWTALSVMAGILGKEVLLAEQVSLQPIAAFIITNAGLAQAVSVLIANKAGAIQKAKAANNYELVTQHLTNAKRLGNAGMFISFLVATLTCVLLVTIPNQISSLFLAKNLADSERKDILLLTRQLLIINGLGLMIDAVRNIGSGALAGFEDVIFAPVLSFITMSILGLSIGGGLTLGLNYNANWLFITRDIGILLAVAGIIYRWSNSSSLVDINHEKKSSNKWCCFFKANAADSLDKKNEVTTPDKGKNVVREYIPH